MSPTPEAQFVTGHRLIMTHLTIFLGGGEFWANEREVLQNNQTVYSKSRYNRSPENVITKFCNTSIVLQLLYPSCVMNKTCVVVLKHLSTILIIRLHQVPFSNLNIW